MTITIDKATLARIRRVAGSRGVSKFIADAARERAGRNELFEYFDELDDKYGPVPLKVYAAVDRDMRKIFGMPPPTKPWKPERLNAARVPKSKARKVRKARKAGSPARTRSRETKPR